MAHAPHPKPDHSPVSKPSPEPKQVPQHAHPSPEPHQVPPNHKREPTDGDIANPVDASDQRTPPVEPVPESWPDRQARVARENERAAGQGKPEPYPHD